jgi:hypothetical protein
MGDPHYVSFDNRYYDFQHYCDYVFVRTTDFECHTRNGDCWGRGVGGGSPGEII